MEIIFTIIQTYLTRGRWARQRGQQK